MSKTAPEKAIRQFGSRARLVSQALNPFHACWIAFLCLAACTPSTVLPVTAFPPSAKTIAIVPAIPDKLIVATRGFTVFGNNLDTPSIAGWRLPDLAYQTSAKLLSPRFEVSEAIPGPPMTDRHGRPIVSLIDGFAPTASELVQTQVQASPPPDLYLVISTGPGSHPYVDAPGTPYYLQDIGVSRQNPPVSVLPALPPIIHCFLLLSLVDGKSFKTIYDTPLLMPPGYAGGAYPANDLKHFAWHDDWANMTPDQQQEIKTGIEDLLTTSLQYTIQHSVMAQ